MRRCRCPMPRRIRPERTASRRPCGARDARPPMGSAQQRIAPRGVGFTLRQPAYGIRLLELVLTQPAVDGGFSPLDRVALLGYFGVVSDSAPASARRADHGGRCRHVGPVHNGRAARPTRRRGDNAPVAAGGGNYDPAGWAIRRSA
jgi:hypothetical protein